MLSRLFTMLLLACALLACGSPAVAAQPDVPAFDLKVEHVDGGEGAKVYQIASNATVAASRAAVWRVLTDYDHLAEFLPNLTSARVVSRSGDKLVVEQLGTARFLFFSQTIRLLVQVQESSPDRIDISLIDGDMKVFRASWELKPVPGAAGTRLFYNATLAPKFDVPGIVGTGVVRKDIGRMMAAVLQRAARQE